MNLKTITDQLLVEKTEHLVREERELLIKVLHCLKEIDRRRLYSELGYKSLFEFAVKKLGYPEDQAYRRLSAMRLLKEIPQIEDKINAGEITLTHINLAQTHFRQEKKITDKELSFGEKLSVIEQIANKPVREAERITFALSSAPELLRADRVKSLSEEYIEFNFKALIRVQEKADRLKGWLAHKYPNLSMGELFDKLCDLGLVEWDPSRGPTSKRKLTSDRAGTKDLKLDSAKSGDSRLARKGSGPASLDKSQSDQKPSLRNFAAPRKSCVVNRAIPARVRRELFKTARSQCENCKSEFALEVDHILPVALGGSSTAENLRVLCRSCNRRSAIKSFGLFKMESYLN